MKRISTLIALLSILAINLSTQAQTWQPVGGNILGNDIHGFGIWNNQLAMGGSFNNNPCDKVAAFDSLNWMCPGGGIGSVVRAVVSWNGNLVACGDFWNINQPCTNCNGVAMWNGTNWTNLGTGFNNDVLCLTVWNGNIVAGGDFTTADGNTCYRVAMWNGTNWSAIGGLDTAFNNDVRALAVYNNQLWVGGDFSNVNGCGPCDRIVKWNGTAWVGGGSGVDIPGGLDSTVRVLYTDQAANRLYMGGHFIEVAGNTNSKGIAVYDGNAWSPLGTGVNSYVRAITKYNGNIIVGGDFTTAGSLSASRVAKWNPTTSSWSTMGAGMNDYLRALITYKGELYAGGAFTQADNQSINYIAKWYEVPAVPPTAGITASATSICLGQCISFTDNSSNSPTSWSWTFNGGTPSSSTLQNPGSVCFSTAGPHIITLQACNSFGCTTTTQTITVSNTPSPTVTVTSSSPAICAGNSATVVASGATSYSWSPSSGLSATTGATVIASPATTTTYTITGTSGSCTGTSTITIIVNPLPVVTATPSSVTLCPNSSASLTAAGASTYAWSPSTGLSASTGSNVTASPSASITYTVTGTDGNGCAATATAAVNTTTSQLLPLVEGFQSPPFVPAGWSLVDAANDGNIWQYNTSVGGFSSTGYCAWYPNNSINAQGTRDEMRTKILDFSSLSTAKMTFDVAYCKRTNASGSDTLSVLASTDCGQTWTMLYIKGGSTLATAPNLNSSFTPTAAQWRTDSINLTAFTGQTAVMFSFRNHNHNGNNLYIDNINITGVNNNPPTPAFTMSADTICPGQCISFTDNTTGLPTGWSWTFAGGSIGSSTSQNPGTVCWNTAGTYAVTLHACNANGCDSVSQSITVMPPAVSAGADDTICAGNSVMLNATGGVTFSWSPTSTLSCATCPGTLATPVATTTYTVIVTDANGCQNSDSVTITVDVCTSLPELAANGIRVYPNPLSTSAMIIELPQQPTAGSEFILVDAMGRIVRRTMLTEARTEVQRADLQNGIYMWMTREKNIITGKGKLMIQ